MEKKRLQKIRKEVTGSQKVQKGLTSIYSNQDGSLPDISHLDVRRRGGWVTLLAVTGLLTLLLGAIGWLAYLVFSPADSASDKSIRVEIESEKNVSSGDEITYTITYTNTDTVVLHNVEFLMRYPTGFTFTQSQPEASNEFQNSWFIGDLERGDSGTIIIQGKMIGEVGEAKVLNITSSFQPENFSSLFKDTTAFSQEITSSIVTLEIEGPDQILPEKKATYTLRYANTSEQALEHVRIMVVYPPDFVFQEAEPAAFHREDDARVLNNLWIIDSLEPEQEGEIIITGGFLNDGEVEQELVAQVGIGQDIDDVAIQQEARLVTTVIQTGLTVSMVINGSPQDQSINFGDTLTYTLVYKNLGTYELDDVVLSVAIDSAVLDWDSLVDKNEGLLENGVLTWSKDQISQLDLVRPLDQGEITFSVPVYTTEDIPTDIAKLQTRSVARAEITQIGEVESEEPIVLEGQPILNNINTDLSLRTEARYFTDDNIAVGTGPLPPVVGDTTTFRIYWSVANSLHAVEDATVTTTLPEGIEWHDKYLVSAGDIAYSSENRTVTWNLSSIPVNSSHDDVRVWFDVAVTPTQQQVRKLLILTDQATLAGTDTETESPVTRSDKALTSNLEDDPYAFGRGLVIDITE